ncbi:response regulator, partial [Vibrio parahaemolyticus]|nr:response regulator [Vibrio parahaemolyticus]
VHEEPAIDSAVLDSITAQTESSQHIEPTISDFDVLDDEDEVESQPAQQVQPTTPHQQAATPSTTFEPAPQKVEVEEVQDNDQDVTAFQDMVSNAQAKVAATQNPFLVQKEENLPVKELLDAVVTDVEMPRMDGMHLVKRLRDTEAFHEMPIIMFSSLMSEDNRAKALSLGANDTITKP